MLEANKQLVNQNSWVKNMEKILKFCFQKEIKIDESLSVSSIKGNLKFKFQDWWKLKIWDDNESKSTFGKKLRNYRTYKTQFRKEDYLNIVKYRPFMSILAKLRLSCHKLQIEIGRYLPPKERLPPTERLCRKCIEKVCEDECHFILHCQAYAGERKIFLEKIQGFCINIDLSSFTEQELFTWLMSNVNENVVLLFTKYLYDIYSKRNNTRDTEI